MTRTSNTQLIRLTTCQCDTSKVSTNFPWLSRYLTFYAKMTTRAAYSLTVQHYSKCQDSTTFIHWHVQNATIPCRFQELLPFFSVVYSFPPPSSPNQSSSLPYFILPSISHSTSQPCCFQNFFENSLLFHSLYMSKPTQSVQSYSLCYKTEQILRQKVLIFLTSYKFAHLPAMLEINIQSAMLII